MQMHADDDMLTQVIEFVAKQTGVPRSDLGPDTMLRFHLDIDGNLAIAFLDAFQRHFSVDMSAFRFTDYFRNDKQILLPSPLLEFILRCVRRIAHRQNRYHPGPQITLGDLARAARRGRWQE